MRSSSQKSEGRRQKAGPVCFLAVRGFLLLLTLGSAAWADDFISLCAARASIERVYYQHRLGTKQPFEETLPRATLESLVRLDLNKEAALKRVYGVAITPAQLAAEVQRINTTTQSPEVLADLKAALGNDPEKFANAFAKPILAERELRQRFDNDDVLHAATRRKCENARSELLAARTNGASLAQLLDRLHHAHSNEVSETTWQLGARPTATNAPTADELEIKKRFGPDAQILSPAPRRAGPAAEILFRGFAGGIAKRAAGPVASGGRFALGFFARLPRPFFGEANGVVADFIPRKRHDYSRLSPR